MDDLRELHDRVPQATNPDLVIPPPIPDLSYVSDSSQQPNQANQNVEMQNEESPMVQAF